MSDAAQQGPGRSTGERVRQVRTDRGLSLSALAAAAGVGKGTLSELEAGRRNPTLDTLYALAGPLGVAMTDLVVEDEIGDGDLHSRRLHVLHEPYALTEVYLIRVRPGAERVSPPHATGVTEQLIVISGEGELEVDGEIHTLTPGAHRSWAADQEHTYRCTGAVELAAVDVIVTPRRADESASRRVGD